MHDESQAQGALRIAGIGASAGGLEAIGELLSTLPSDTGMAFLVVQHLDPRHDSMLGELLAKRTRMPVKEAFDGQHVEPNHVYIIAPNTSMTIARRCLSVRPRVESRHPPMPIDILFESLAQDAGPAAIGVILSGTGSDGALGMRAIKAEGGHTFVQDEATARFSSMARAALELDAAELQLPPREIAQALVRISEDRPVKQPVATVAEATAVPDADAASDEDGLRQIFQLLRSTCKVEFSHYKRGTIDRRLDRRRAMRQCTTLQEYLEQLRSDPAEVRALCRDLLINVTSFFRDPHSFDELARVVWPRLTEGRTSTEPLRLWVPGCATGEEAYSLAISLLEYLGDSAAVMRIQIFGTDVSEAAIDTARAGQYIETIARDVSPERLQRHFVKLDGHYQVAKAVRELCIFSRHDVTRDPPFSRLDLVSCRNLMIYLDAPAQKRLLPTFHYALKPGGFLTLGPAESLGTASDLFRAIDGGKSKIYERRSTPARLPTVPAELRAHPADAVESSIDATGPAGLDRLEREADRVAQARYMPAGVLCDDALNVVQFRGDTAAYLVNPPGAPTRDLQMLARPGLLVELGTAVRQAREDGKPVRRDGLRIEGPDGALVVDLEVLVVQPTASAQRGFLIFFEPAAASPPPSGVARASRWASLWSALRGEAQGRPLPHAAWAEIERLEHALEGSRAHVRAMLEEHQSAIEELKTAQEELLSSNEEFQSTNEELETAKEELQSTNEELSTTNDELRHRNVELHLLTEGLREARDAAEAIVETAREPMLVLDRDLRIVRVNRAFCTVFRLAREASEGALIDQLGNGAWDIPALHDLLDASRSGAPLKDYEVRHVFPDIGARVMHLNATRLDWPGHGLILLAIEDVTEREAVLESLRSNERRTHEFLAMLGHELRNPLAAMRAAWHICRRAGSTDAMRARALEIMGRQLEKETLLISDLLDMSRVTHGLMVLEKKPVDLAAVVAQAVDEVRAAIDARRHDLRVEVPPTAIIVEGDATRLEQLVVNLLGNSAKFTPPGGRIGLVLRREGEHAELGVTDNGIGIATDVLPTVFDLFSQATTTPDRANGGLGLGLTLVRRIAELHGGTVEVSSRGLNHGAEFVVRLPALPESAGTAAGDAPAAVRAAASRILLVEDNADAAASLAILLQLDGHEVETRGDGLAAIEAARAFVPDVVLIDIALPGIDGHAVARRLRELPQTRPALIVALTGYGQESDRRLSDAAGFDHHLVKPADPELINALVAAHRGMAG